MRRTIAVGRVQHPRGHGFGPEAVSDQNARRPGEVVTKDELFDLLDDVADALAEDDVDAARDLLGLDDDADDDDEDLDNEDDLVDDDDGGEGDE